MNTYPDQTPPGVLLPCDPSKVLARAAELIETLALTPHPEGGWYRECFRSTATVQPDDGRPTRSALTSIDFLLVRGQFSAWHRVQSDEAWHVLEGEGLRLWLLPPAASAGTDVQAVDLGGAGLRRHVVPRGWWQAAEPLGDMALVGATVGPGFEFEDFSFGRDDAELCARLRSQRPDLQRLL